MRRCGGCQSSHLQRRSRRHRPAGRGVEPVGTIESRAEGLEDFKNFSLSMSTSSHDDWFKTFVRRYLRAEVIEDVLRALQIAKFPDNADAFFENRRFIAELKTLETSRVPRIQKVIDTLIERREVPDFYGQKPVDEVIKDHPNKNKLKRQFLQEITKRLGKDFLDAHGQIRETKTYFNLPNARGIFIATNVLLAELTPEIVWNEFSRWLMKRDRNGNYAYPDIELAIYVQTVSVIEINKDNAQMPTIIMTREEDGELSTFSTEFVKEFSKAIGYGFAEYDNADLSSVLKATVSHRRFKG